MGPGLASNEERLMKAWQRASKAFNKVGRLAGVGPGGTGERAHAYVL